MRCDGLNLGRTSLSPITTSKGEPKEMLVKIYEACWGVLLTAAIITLVTGNFGLTAMVVFGFAGFGMVFMGMISVLPDVSSHPSHK
jgi:hypothetical protein